MAQTLNKPTIGLVGDAAVGKDFVAHVFEKFGYVHHSSSDILRDEIRARNLTISRETQTKVANQIRLTEGGAYFVVRALDKAHQSNPEAPVLLSGIYALTEGEYITKSLGGTIVDITTGVSNPLQDIEMRFASLKRRGDGPRDDLEYLDFLQAHERENSGEGPLEANINSLRKLASFTIVNSPGMGVDELQSQVSGILSELGCKV